MEQWHPTVSLYPLKITKETTVMTIESRTTGPKEMKQDTSNWARYVDLVEQWLDDSETVNKYELQYQAFESRVDYLMMPDDVFLSNTAAFQAAKAIQAAVDGKPWVAAYRVKEYHEATGYASQGTVPPSTEATGFVSQGRFPGAPIRPLGTGD